MDRIALIGYRGSGKSTVGPLLATELGWNFHDADRILEANAGRTIAEIFATDGEETFRDLETETLARLMTETHAVIATGGGVVLRSANRELLKTAFVVWLDTPAEVCWERIRGDVSRPNLAGGGCAEVEQLMAVRRPLYFSTANLILDGRRKPTELVDSILTAHGSSLIQ